MVASLEDQGRFYLLLGLQEVWLPRWRTREGSVCYWVSKRYGSLAGGPGKVLFVTGSPRGMVPSLEDQGRFCLLLGLQEVWFPRWRTREGSVCYWASRRYGSLAGGPGKVLFVTGPPGGMVPSLEDQGRFCLLLGLQEVWFPRWRTREGSVCYWASSEGTIPLGDPVTN